jgi:dehydrogenase/reductase SDR family protein 1
MTVIKPAPEPYIITKCIVGTASQNTLQGQVCLLTGGSRGIGKGICQELARAGAIVYVTGRSTAKDSTDKLLAGSVDETVMQLNRLGGQGIAVHADHAQMVDNKKVVELIEKQHGKLDVLVNNAFFIPKPDKLFFGNRIWNQPTRFLNEQIAVGSYNHACMTLLLVSALRRGKGMVCGISSWGSQSNLPIFPTSYFVNKAAFDGTLVCLNDMLRNKYNICSISVWPGSVRSERSELAAKRSGEKLSDLESSRFTGRAVTALAEMPAEELMAYALNGTVISADVMVDKCGGHDIDGYKHEKKLLSYFGQSLPQNPMYMIPRHLENGFMVLE